MNIIWLITKILEGWGSLYYETYATVPTDRVMMRMFRNGEDNMLFDFKSRSSECPKLEIPSYCNKVINFKAKF